MHPHLIKPQTSNQTIRYHTIPPHSATTPPRLTSPHHPNHHHNHNTIPTYNHNTITITTPKPLPIHFLDLFIATKPPTHHSHSTPPVRPSTTTLPLLSHPIPVPRETHLACRILPSIVLSIPLLFHLGTVLRLRTLWRRRGTFLRSVVCVDARDMVS